MLIGLVSLYWLISLIRVPIAHTHVGHRQWSMEMWTMGIRLDDETSGDGTIPKPLLPHPPLISHPHHHITLTVTTLLTFKTIVFKSGFLYQLELCLFY